MKTYNDCADSIQERNMTRTLAVIWISRTTASLAERC